jgi:Alpha/beta hydrolase domain
VQQSTIEPDRNVQQHANRLYPGAEFPFTYPVITDAATGRTDGWLRRCRAASNCPKIIQTDTQLEFCQSLASLVTTDTKGEPLAMPDNARLFLLSSLQHAAPANAKSSLSQTCSFPTNPLFAGPTLRALLVAMDEWITSAKPPPESRYPSRTNGTLVVPTAEAVGFPRIPGLDYKGVMNEATVVDYNIMPPAKRAPYPAFVPKSDADGNDIAGVRLPTLAAPVATHLGWNQRKAGFAEGELCENTGSMLPFAKTREERLRTNDPRLSLAERYPHDGDRAVAIDRAAKQLVQDRLLLEEDVKGFQQATN